jgi:hypothetical protein
MSLPKNNQNISGLAPRTVTLPPKVRPVCNEGFRIHNVKCCNCYSYGAPCANCASMGFKANSKMTWNEYKSVCVNNYTNVTYEQFCEKMDNFAATRPDLFVSISDKYKYKKDDFIYEYDEYDSSNECRGPYSEDLSRCFGSCCN